MKKMAAWALCAAWMILIFSMSATPGEESAMQSSFVTGLVLRVMAAVAGESAAQAIPVDTLTFLVRKAAHMTEYAVLFLLLCHALHLSGALHPARTALLLSAAYAATDELHQCFTDGRGPSPVDVLIDTCGASAALGVRAAFCRLTGRRKAHGN